MNDKAVREKLSEALGQLAMRGGYGLGVLASERLAADLLPVVREIAAEELRAAAEELDDIAAHLDPQQRSTGTPRGYRLSAHHNRSIAAVLTSSHE